MNWSLHVQKISWKYFVKLVFCCLVGCFHYFQRNVLGLLLSTLKCKIFCNIDAWFFLVRFKLSWVVRCCVYVEVQIFLICFKSFYNAFDFEEVLSRFPELSTTFGVLLETSAFLSLNILGIFGDSQWKIVFQFLERIKLKKIIFGLRRVCQLFLEWIPGNAEGSSVCQMASQKY